MEQPMHPYRDAPMRPASTIDPEGFVLYGMLMAIGAIPAVVAIVDGGAFGVDATLGLIMVVLGAAGLRPAWRLRTSRRELD
jgi:hypothetical protein